MRNTRYRPLRSQRTGLPVRSPNAGARSVEWPRAGVKAVIDRQGRKKRARKDGDPVTEMVRKTDSIERMGHRKDQRKTDNREKCCVERVHNHPHPALESSLMPGAGASAHLSGHRKTCGATDYGCGRLEEGAFTEDGELEAGFKGFPDGVQRPGF